MTERAKVTSRVITKEMERVRKERGEIEKGQERITLATN